jgi:DNA helicase-2/ATP-dependent DNA helicase PcrA
MTFNVDARRQAILDAQGHCLVLGGPGSGKTTLALHKAGARIGAGLTPGQNVLFLSFSRAAVGRILDATKTSQISAAVRSQLSVQTFHSFFWHILRSHGYLLGSPQQLTLLSSHDEKALRRGINDTSDLWGGWVTERRRLFHDEGRVCFDLFAPLTTELLRKAARLRRRISSCYPLILVDEAQDTSAEQWECARLLAEQSQVICLGDPNQMIFDHLPGVGAQRLEDIRQALNPVEVDLGGDNNRSPGTEIAVFANDVLKGARRVGIYAGVSKFAFHPAADKRDIAIRRSIGIVNAHVRAKTGEDAESIAVITTFGKGVAIVSAALRKGKPIPHHVVIDEAVVLLASRLGAYLLEPRNVAERNEEIALCLDLLARASQAKGSTTSLAKGDKFSRWALTLRQGKNCNFELVQALRAVLLKLDALKFQGVPGRDWISMRRLLEEAEQDDLMEVARSLEYLIAFNRGARISDGLASLWTAQGSYAGAREALEVALAQDQIMGVGEELGGIHVMNVHRAKGKQFDGVVLFRSQHASPFAWPKEAPPYPRSRKVLQVAITRAKHHVLILDEAFPACPIINAFNL